MLSVHAKKNTVSVFIGIFFSPSRWLFHPFSYKDMLTWLGQFLYLSCITRELEISILSILKLKWAETEENRFRLSKTVSFHNKERKKTHNRGPSWINEEKSIWTKTPVIRKIWMCSPFETLTHTHKQIYSIVLVNLSYIDFFFHIEGFASNCKLFFFLFCDFSVWWYMYILGIFFSFVFIHATQCIVFSEMF